MEEKRIILLMYCEFRNENEKKIKRKGVKNNPIKYIEYIARIIKRRESSVRKIWNDFIKLKKFQILKEKGNKKRNKTKVFHTKACKKAVFEFIQEKWSHGRRVVSKDVMKFLHENNFINIDLTNSKSMLKNVQRY